MERATGIEPAFSAWEADVLPLNYARGDAQRIPGPVGRPSANRVEPAAVPTDMIDATALLFLHALDRTGLRHGRRPAA